ncbi:MAG: ankyrin repeat domain-containing protein [Candidatus Micrarchaeia archaeon]
MFLEKLNAQLLKSAKKGDLKGVQDAINEGANVNVKNDYGQTALIYAVHNGHTLFLEKVL